MSVTSSQYCPGLLTVIKLHRVSVCKTVARTGITALVLNCTV